MKSNLRLVDSSMPTGSNNQDTTEDRVKMSIRKSHFGGWNGELTKMVDGKKKTLFCSSEFKDEILTWALDKIRD